MKSVTPLCIVAVIALLSAAVTASPLTNSETKELEKEALKGALATSCEALSTDPSSTQASSCRYYLYGFVDAGHAIDRASLEQFEKDDTQRPSFTERAYRTRVGVFDERHKTVEILMKPFCIPQGESRERVIDRLARYFPDSIDNLTKLGTSVYKGLNAEYPCS